MSGKRIKEIRELMKMTQSDFGEKLGFNWCKIKDLETGRLKVTSEIALLIEKIFSVNFRWLLTGEGPMFITELKDQDRLVNIPDPTGDLAAAVRLLAEMPENKRRDCLSYIQEKKLLLDLQREIEKIKAG